MGQSSESALVALASGRQEAGGFAGWLEAIMSRPGMHLGCGHMSAGALVIEQLDLDAGSGRSGQPFAWRNGYEPCLLTAAVQPL